MIQQQTMAVSETPDPWQPPATLADCRRDLAQAEADLRGEQHALAILRAQVEHAAIEAAGGTKALGSNADDRARALILALEQDAEYTDCLLDEAILTRRVLRLKAEIACHEDARRGDELAARERLISLLERIETGRSLDDAALETAAGLIVLPDRATWDGGAD